MAFDTNNFARLSSCANSNIPALWGYSTTDSTGDVDNSGYFDGVADKLQVGDVIMCNTTTGGTMVAGNYKVESNTGSVVNVNATTAFSETTGG